MSVHPLSCLADLNTAKCWTKEWAAGLGEAGPCGLGLMLLGLEVGSGNGFGHLTRHVSPNTVPVTGTQPEEGKDPSSPGEARDGLML